MTSHALLGTLRNVCRRSCGMTHAARSGIFECTGGRVSGKEVYVPIPQSKRATALPNSYVIGP